MIKKASQFAAYHGYVIASFSPAISTQYKKSSLISSPQPFFSFPMLQLIKFSTFNDLKYVCMATRV